MFYVSGFNFDSSDLTNDADIDGTVVSGTATYSNSQNSGKSFDMGSAVVDINVGENTGFGKYYFPFFTSSGNILEFELKVDSDATDGVILACDEINADVPVWAISLVDTASTPKLQVVVWADNEDAGTTTNHSNTFDITIPSGNGWNHYQLIYASTSIKHRVNGGTQSSYTVNSLTQSNWSDVNYHSVNNFEYEINIGRSQYGTTATNNTLSTGASATNCHLDWIFLHPFYTNGLDRNKGSSNITDQSYPEAKYFYGKLTSAEIIETPVIKEASTEAVSMDRIPLFSTEPVTITTTAETISVGPVVEASDGEVQKEFWS